MCKAHLQVFKIKLLYVEGLAASTADCWLEVRMLPEDPNISQIDQGFSVDFLGSRQLPSQHKLKISAQSQASQLIFCHSEALQMETSAKFKI